MSAEPLVGRVTELRALTNSVATARGGVLTLWGPGGIGKTRLARELARDAATLLEGGATFCALESARRETDVTTIVGRALGATASRTRSHDDELARIGRAIAARKRTLVVLDNVEQVLGAACDALRTWRALAPEATFVVTSRELTGISGELPTELAPLSVPRTDAEVATSDAASLLVLRARAVRPDFEGDPHSLREIVSRLDGIPLAIELAAARLAVMSAEQLAKRLDRRFELLALGHGGASPRQRTLRGAIDWSWELLEDAEQRALADLSVFSGAFDLDAAEAVLDPPAAAASLLHALRSKSLVVTQPSERGAPPRFSLLESIREYAREKLGARASEVADRHAAYFSGAAEARAPLVDGHEGEEALRWLAREHANLLAAVDRHLERGDAERAMRAVLALEPMLSIQGSSAQTIELIGRIESSGREIEPPTRARALEARAAAHLHLGQLQEASTAVEKSLASAADDLPRARHLVLASAIRQAQGRYDDAMKSAREALVLAEGANEKRLLGQALSCIALVHHITDELASAQSFYERALALHVEVGHLRAEIRTRARLGFLMQDLGRSDDALAECERARAAEEKLDSRQLEGVLVGYEGNVRRAQGRNDEARALYARALEHLRRSGDRRFEATFTMDRAIAAILEASYASALEDLSVAAAIVEEVGDSKLGGLIAGYEVAARAGLGDRDGAARALERVARSITIARDPATRALLDIHAAQLPLLEAEHDDSLVEMALARAKAVLERLPIPVLGEHRRLAARLLQRSIDRLVARRSGWVVADDGTTLRPPGAAWIDLSTHPSTCRVLAVLAQRRVTTPGTPIDAAELVAAGWPSEKMAPSAGANRLRVLLTSLRAAGLRDVIRGEKGGYWLDPSIPLSLEKAPLQSD